MKILQLTSHFSPNVGGVETHLDDLVEALIKRKHSVFVLTYQPLTTKVDWKFHEKRRNLEILRIPWVFGLFYKLVKTPFLEFIYLLPGLLFFTPFVILLNRPDVIHSHGLIAGFVATFWGKLFGVKVITTTHSIYNFPETGAYRSIAAWIFKGSKKVLTLSEQSKNEIQKLGVDSKKVVVFTYWVDLNKFTIKSSKSKIRKELGWSKNKFIVLFVGRLLKEKGVKELLSSVSNWNRNISLAIAGTGPMEKEIQNSKLKVKSLFYLGKVDNDKLPDYYTAVDLVIVPSTHEEGFGRVILESLACGTPVIGSKRGAIPEAMDDTVGRLINVTPKNIKDTVEHYYRNPDELARLSSNARKFSEERYSEKNIDAIISVYS